MAFTKEQIEEFKKIKNLTKEELKNLLEKENIKLSDKELEQLKKLISTEDNIEKLCSKDINAVTGGIGEEMSPKMKRALNVALKAGLTISAAVTGGLIYANKDRIGKLFGRSNNPAQQPNPIQQPNSQQPDPAQQPNPVQQSNPTQVQLDPYIDPDPDLYLVPDIDPNPNHR